MRKGEDSRSIFLPGSHNQDTAFRWPVRPQLVPLGGGHSENVSERHTSSIGHTRAV